MLEQLQHPDKNTRILAVTAIGQRRDTSALPDLLHALRTERDPFVQENITWSLVRLGPIVIQPLIDLAGHADASVRHYAVHTLGKIGDAQAVEAVASATQDPDATVQMKAAFVLGQLKDPRAIPTLVHLLGHTNDTIRNTVGDVLEQFGATALPALFAALTHPDWPVREQAIDILGQIADPAGLPHISAALADPHTQVRLAAQTALRHMRDKH